MTKPSAASSQSRLKRRMPSAPSLPPAGEQGGLIGQGGELTQGPVGEEAHEVDQAVEEDEQ